MQSVDFQFLWRQLAAGNWFLAESFVHGDLSYATVRESPSQRAPAPISVQVLERVLLGEQPKTMADEFGLSVSTISAYCAHALTSMGSAGCASTAPILLVMAVHAAAGRSQLPLRVEARAGSTLVVSADTPGRSLRSYLSPCEQEVAHFCIKGMTHRQIAEARRTSARTIANQICSLYKKLRVSGRAELRAAAVRADNGRSGVVAA